jgi:hypothetical protein
MLKVILHVGLILHILFLSFHSSSLIFHFVQKIMSFDSSNVSSIVDTIKQLS